MSALREVYRLYLPQIAARKRAQGSNLRKMQIGDSANFPRLDKLTGCQPYPPSRPDSRANRQGCLVVDEVCETEGAEIERITARSERIREMVLFITTDLQTSFIIVR